MAEQVNIASLTINVDDVIKESARLKKQIDALKKSQKELDTSTEEGAQAFAKTDVELRNLNKAYKDNQQFAAALDETNKDLNKTMSVQGKSTQELYDSRRQLNQIAKNIQGNTEEEIELRQQLNVAIDEQTAALRDQQSEFNSGKDSIGEYTQGINAADFNLRDLVKSSSSAGGASNLLAGTFKSAAKQMLVLTKATLRFIATPVGAILTAIVAAFALIKNAVNRSEESLNKVRKAASGVVGMFKTVLKVLQPVGDFLIKGLVKGFELVEKGITKALNFIQKALDRLGFEKAAARMESFNEQIEEGVKAAKELADAELAYNKAQREARKTQLQFQKDAEKLRQIRDDETKSFEERIAANEELGRVLNKQLNEELELAQKALDLANLRIQLEGETKEALDERAAAETEIIDIQERITGQVSEQLTNQVSLQREATEEINEAKEQEAEAAEEVAKRKAEAAKEAAETSVEWAEFELNQYIRKNKAKADSDKFFSEQALLDEEQRLLDIATKQRQFEDERFIQGVSDEVEYNKAKAAIEEEYQNNLAAARLQRSEAEKLRIAIDADNRLQIIEEAFQSELQLEQFVLEQKRLQEVAAAEKTGADVAAINEKYAQRQKALDGEVQSAKLDGFKQVFDSYASILGEETKAGKAAAIASTIISTYQAAQQSYTSLAGIPIVGVGLGIAAAGASVIAGLQRIQKIRGTSTQFAEGDILKGRSHARGGIPFSIGGRLGFEAEGGEALINKRSTAMFRPLLSAMNEAGGGKRFATGGIAGSTSSLPSSLLIDYDLLAARIAEANVNLPNPVVSVEEINTVNNNVSVVERLATS